MFDKINKTYLGLALLLIVIAIVAYNHMGTMKKMRLKLKNMEDECCVDGVCDAKIQSAPVKEEDKKEEVVMPETDEE